MPAAAQARTDLPGRAATPAGATIICLIAVIVLPLLSFPLSWLPAAAGPRSFTIPWGPLLAVPVLLMAAWHLARYGTIGGRRTVTWCSLALLVSALLGVRFSDQPHASLSVLPVVVSNLVLFVAASRLPAASRWLLAWGWIAAAGLVAVNGLGRLGHEPEFLSVIGNRNLLGAYLASGICLGTGLAVHRDTSRSLRWLALGAAVLLVVALWFCGSRGAWLGLLAGLAAFGVLSLPRGRLALSLVLVLVLVLVSGLLPWTRAHLARQWRADVRPVIWAGTIRMVEDRPLLGHGLGSYLLVYPQYRLPTYFARPKAAPVTDHAHNEFLETAAEQGLLGLGVLVAVWALALGRGGKMGRREDGPPGAATRLGAPAVLFLPPAIVLFVHALLDIGLRVLPLGPLTWVLLGLLIGGSPANTPEPGFTWKFRGYPARILNALALIATASWLLVAGVIQPVRADLAERRAERALAQGDLTGALLAARDSLRSAPFRLRLRYRLAQLLAEMGTIAARHEAIKMLHALEQLAPHYAQVDYNLGVLYAAEARYDQARPYLAAAVRSNPADADARQLLERVRAARTSP